MSTERDSLTKFNVAAKEFAAQHVAELARNLNQWQDTGLLPDECKLRELNLLCFKISPFNSAMLAESIANRACRDAAALAQPVAASDVQVPNTFKPPGESDEAWVDRITGAQPVAAEPFAYLVERSAFRVSPHGQDAESNEWIEEAKSDEPGAFPVYRHPPPTPA